MNDARRAQSIRDCASVSLGQRCTSAKPRAALRMLREMDVMSEPTKLRCYAYLDRPYERVRELLRRQPLDLLQRATHSASARANSLAASLKVAVAGVEIGVVARTYLHRVKEDEAIAGLPPVTCLEFGWEASRTPAFFPAMRAELSVWPLTSTETQLEITGEYRPPLGVVGDALDAALGHRVAEAVVHRFLEDIVEEIRHELPDTA